MYFWMKNQNFCRKVFDNLPPVPPKTLFAFGVQSFVVLIVSCLSRL